MEFQRILKHRRKELGYTLKEIADKIGVTEATVQRWESGNIKTLRHGRISKLADVLEISPSVLMGWEDENPFTDYIAFTPNTSALTQNLLVFNMNGTEGAHGMAAPSIEVINEINKLGNILKLCPVEQITALLKLVESGGNIPLKAELPAELKELLVSAADLPPEKIATLIQVAEGMKK